jgi:hypothetical protein
VIFVAYSKNAISQLTVTAMYHGLSARSFKWPY